MTERGGPTTQNIVYQNKVAALYLGDLLSFDDNSRDRVVEVRVEAPARVDDVVVRYADGHRQWIQAKLTLTKGTPAWNKLWRDFHIQRQSGATADLDRLTLVLGESTSFTGLLQECAVRTTDSPDAQWRTRLSDSGRDLVAEIEGLIGASPYSIFERLNVETITNEALQESLVANRMPTSNVGAETLHDVLTTLAGDAGRQRATFNFRDLHSQLRTRAIPIAIEPPEDWGLGLYLRVHAKARISVPGTSVGGDVVNAFCWPRTALTEQFQRDFDDEQELERLEEEPEALDFQHYPSPEFASAIVHAGPGFGKSALFVALGHRLASEGRYAPAIVPLGALADGDLDVLSYLKDVLNKAYHVSIGWKRLLETGAAVVMFDGFDEVPPDRRIAVAEKLAVFAGRFPDAPWLLSVRDPAYVPAQIDAPKVELLPLLDREMRGFIEHVSPDISPIEVERLIAQIQGYPDLQRLVRIPLFLALLVATQRPGEALPSRRSELIEAYLNTLFRPEEHKITPRLRDPDRLREAMQTLAFDLLQKGRIGADQRAVQRLLKSFATDRISTYHLSDDAITCGILRREVGGRLNFPFPIVQEYLAAQELVENHAEEIVARAVSGVDRPWAQTIQFALEQLVDASDIIRDLLGRQDDPFVSATRMLARCVINGMACDDDLRAEIGDRLVAAWSEQSYWTKRRIGRLLQDGWARPLAPSVRDLILKRDFFHDGGSDILADLENETLTLAFLTSALENNRLPPHLGEFQAAVNRIAPKVFPIYLDSVRQRLWSDDRLWEAAIVVRRLDGRRIPAAELAAATVDPKLSVGVRLACLSLSAAPDEALLMELAIEALRLPKASDQWPAIHAIAALKDPEAFLAQLLRRDDLHEIAHKNIIEHLDDTLPEHERSISFLRTQAASNVLSDELRLNARVWGAIRGDVDAIKSLVAAFATLPEKALRPLIWTINKTPDFEAGERLVAAMRARSMSPDQRSISIGNLIFGAANDIKPFSWDSCTMSPAKPHPAFPLFIGLLSEWRDADDYDLEAKLRIETEACRARIPGATESLQRLATEVAMTEDLGGERNPLYIVLHNAMQQLERQRCLLPLSAAIRLTEVVQPIDRQHTLSHIGAMGTREALDYLLTWSDKPGYQKSQVLYGIEQTAARLGLKIIRTGKKLAVAA